ncbi:MAG: tetratricopeptide repeat protein, partial [Dokdonella sp.]|uniref:O-linked N-acetylglucosamine transferase family protein n=1 Tax=Dokdonella sp. TaxID=2291710 RepID=UPI00326460BB
MNSPLSADLDAALDRIAGSIDAGQPQSAVVAAIAARSQWPHEVEPARLHGIALFQLGQIANARRALDDARAIAPQSVEVACNLASVLLAEGDTIGAISVLDAMLAREPRHPAVLNGLGTAKRAAGDLAGSRDAYARATAEAPAHAAAWMNLAAVELALGHVAKADHDTRHALTLAPAHPEGLLLLGHVLATQRRHADAERAYLAGAQSAPSDARFAYQAGLMAEEQGRLAPAADAHARALSLTPSLHHALGQLVFLRRQLSDWRGLDALSADLRARVAAGAPGIAPFAFLAEPASADEQLRCARTCADGIDARTATQRTRFPFVHRQRRSTDPLRIGMVANGFGNHPTSLLIVAMIEALRSDAIEIHLFSTAPDDSSVLLHRLRAAVHTLHDASSATAPVLAATIHAADVELLLDLDGYCSGAMPEALALRPAPIQINWLAYPGTLGAAWMDYVIADAVVLPRSLH